MQENPLTDTLINLQPKLLRYLYSKTKNQHRAEDILGAFNLKVLQVERRPENENLEAYLFSGLNNFLRDTWRTEKRHNGLNKPCAFEGTVNALENIYDVYDVPYSEIPVEPFISLLTNPDEIEIIRYRLDNPDSLFQLIANERGLSRNTVIGHHSRGVRKIKQLVMEGALKGFLESL